MHPFSIFNKKKRVTLNVPQDIVQYFLSTDISDSGQTRNFTILHNFMFLQMSDVGHECGYYRSLSGLRLEIISRPGAPHTSHWPLIPSADIRDGKTQNHKVEIKKRILKHECRYNCFLLLDILKFISAPVCLQHFPALIVGMSVSFVIVG